MPIHALIRDAERGHWLAFDDPIAVLCAARVDDVPRIIAQAESRARGDGLHAVGFLTYEAAAGLDAKLCTYAPGVLPPAWFALFDRPRAVAGPLPSWPPPLAWRPTLPVSDYLGCIDRIREWIAAGDSYQVNFTYRLQSRIDCSDPSAAARLFGAMVRRQPAGHGAFLETADWALCSASPELFFTRRGQRVTCRPMKGTAPRGDGSDEDTARAAWLRDSLKNRAENLMITDMVRSDVGRLATVGSVETQQLFQLERHPTLWQMTSTVSGETHASLADVFRALFPAASITGAPKRRTMEIIRELEPVPREIYTGTMGVVTPDGDACFNVAIRTALVDKRRSLAEYGVGGGILWDSDPAQEHAETLTKARILVPETDGDFSLLETLLWRPGHGFRFLEDHLARMNGSAMELFGAGVDAAHVRRRLQAAMQGAPPVPHRVRVLVSREGDIRVSAAALDTANRPRRVVLATSRSPLIDNPFVRHKTTRRDVYEAARRDPAVTAAQADDVLLVNERGEVTESTIANLIVRIGGRLVTPPASAGLLPGLYRRQLLASGRITERTLLPEHVCSADAVWLANSVRGFWRVQLVRG